MFSYVSGGNSFPRPLSAEEEEKYITEYQNGSEEAKNILIERNLRLVAHIAKKYSSNSSYDSDDLISIGTIGLIKAVTTFKPTKATKLATYAARCIENAILT
ncbi:MAG: sigma-70 family RNA polymerase sigma factor [Firmicutes bacterium]|nr:sigma-70 family RNA polymerase sigma factor [Bacillota bacterium]